MANDKSPINPSMAEVSRDFCSSMNAVRLLTERLEPVANEHDKAKIDTLAGILDRVKVIKDQESSGVVSSSNRDGVQPQADDPVAAESEKPSESIRIKFEDASHFKQLLKHAKLLANEPPNTAAILRRSVLMVTISHLDALMARILRIYYRMYPDALPADQKTIHLSELKRAGTVDAAIDIAIDNEVDSFLHKSISDQFAYFEDRLKLDLSGFSEYRNRIIETVQRRHILVHNGGIASRLYMSRIDDELATEYDIEVGKEVTVDGDYVRRAIDRVHLAGIVIIQHAWRKWWTDETNIADDDINEHLFFIIERERYTAAQVIGTFATSLEYTVDRERRYALLNLAQAYKWSGDTESMKQVLDDEDWTSCDLLLQLALHALRDEHDDFFTKLPRAVAAKDISREALHEWPIFRSMRENSQFAGVVKDLFPIADPASASKETTPMLDVDDGDQKKQGEKQADSSTGKQS